MKTNEIYSLRNSFSIIGLTGRTGSGCTRFSEIISRSIEYDRFDVIRRPSDVGYISQTFLNPKSDNNTVFKRKYTICYDYFKKYNKPYKTIHYISVILFYTIHYGVRKGKITSEDSLVDYLYDIIRYNFKKSEIKGKDSDYTAVKIEKKEIRNLSKHFGKILELFLKLNLEITDIKEANLDDLFDCFFGREFSAFSSRLFKLVGEKDYYLGSFLVHGLGNKIRATGDPTRRTRNLGRSSTKNIYNLVKIINKLIKAWKSNSKDKRCHICIDSLRNSLEIMFLKERYSAFYMIAIHNENRYKKRIEDRIKDAHGRQEAENPNPISLTLKKVLRLDKAEHDASDFKKGKFYAPDVETCIQKSDIHINNPGKDVFSFDSNLRGSNFYSMTEQWIKINSLILHPGLITPSHDERCMQIALDAKLNSGCISRQVGAVITDANNSIKSIGWNDVPKGAIPCNLRDLADIVEPNRIDLLDLSYSAFELDQSDKEYKEGGGFSKKTRELFSKDVELTNKIKLNHSFCFKTLHNRYEKKDNQVHTRSLHAEENAMLQISKFGGQPLKGGTLYTTASPCELCAKKAYQLGLQIVYIDPYPGISMQHILVNGYSQPNCKMFNGIIGKAYNKLFEPLMSYKDELSLETMSKEDERLVKVNEVRNAIKDVLGIELKEDIDIKELKNKINEIN
nr:hypothetical protein [uncultured Carboxylicivirga sp.]